MDDPLADWPRPYYEGPGGTPSLFYVVYGAFGDVPALESEKYRSMGVYPGLTLGRYDRSRQAEVVDSFREGFLWDELLAHDPELARRVQATDECLILQGKLEDQADLNYLRDTVGLLAFLLDHGGVAIFDPQMLRWWTPDDWRQQVFEPATADLGQHIIMLISEEDDGEGEPRAWIHSQGMGKFGRPDVSVRHVPARYQEAVVDLCHRLITLQALGGVVPEGQEIEMDPLPPGLICRHDGNADNPDFNNAHIEITGLLAI